MPYLIESNNELMALNELIRIIIRKGEKNGNYFELLNCLLTIDYNRTDWMDYCKFIDNIIAIGGAITRHGWKKATLVYTTLRDRQAKPSYLKRLVQYPDKPRKLSKITTINQLKKIAYELSSKPGLSNLSFVIFRPSDLYDLFRPGYVPCPIAGDFKFRHGKLYLNVMFRTCDALAVAFADIYYLRKLQLDVLELSKKISTCDLIKNGEPGQLSLYFSRTYIEKKKRIKDKTISYSIDTMGIVKELLKEIKKKTKLKKQ